PRRERRIAGAALVARRPRATGWARPLRRRVLAPRSVRGVPRGAGGYPRPALRLRRHDPARDRARTDAPVRGDGERRRLRPVRVVVEPERRALCRRAPGRARRGRFPRLDPRRPPALRRARRPRHARLRAVPVSRRGLSVDRKSFLRLALVSTGILALPGSARLSRRS